MDLSVSKEGEEKDVFSKTLPEFIWPQFALLSLFSEMLANDLPSPFLASFKLTTRRRRLKLKSQKGGWMQDGDEGEQNCG